MSKKSHLRIENGFQKYSLLRRAFATGIHTFSQKNSIFLFFNHFRRTCWRTRLRTRSVCGHVHGHVLGQYSFVFFNGPERYVFFATEFYFQNGLALVLLRVGRTTAPKLRRIFSRGIHFQSIYEGLGTLSIDLSG